MRSQKLQIYFTFFSYPLWRKVSNYSPARAAGRKPVGLLPFCWIIESNRGFTVCAAVMLHNCWSRAKIFARYLYKRESTSRAAPILKINHKAGAQEQDAATISTHNICSHTRPVQPSEDGKWALDYAVCHVYFCATPKWKAGLAFTKYFNSWRDIFM